MRDIRPYEQELVKKLSELRVPDANAAWEEMKKLKEQKKPLDQSNQHNGKSSSNRKKIAWWLLSLLLITSIAWLFIHNEGETKSSSNKTNIIENNSSTNQRSKEAIVLHDYNKNEATNNTHQNESNIVYSTSLKNAPVLSKNKMKNDSLLRNNKNAIHQNNFTNNPLPYIYIHQTEKHKDALNNSNTSSKNIIAANNDGNMEIRENDSLQKIGNSAVKRIGLHFQKHSSKTNLVIKNTNFIPANDDSSTSKNHGVTISNNTYKRFYTSIINTSTTSQKKLSYKKRYRSNNKAQRLVINRKSATLNISSSMAESIIQVDSSSKTTNNNESFSKIPYSAAQQKAIPLLTDTISKKDSIIMKQLVAIKKTSASTDTAKQNKKRKNYLAAGITEQQPINLYENNDNASSPSGSDYIPSIYFRLYHSKWFLQTELKYAAPQYVNAFTYKTTLQNLPFNYITTSYTVKKINYSQVLASAHYFITPNWSIGAGVSYNLFSGANIQEEVHKKLYGSSNDSLLASISITDKDDSSFSTVIKNTFELLLETQYQWKHFSLGMRYGIGLEPYAKYTDPVSASATQQNNYSLNVFIRCELWESKKKRHDNHPKDIVKSSGF